MGLDLSAGDIRALMSIARADGVRQCEIAKAMNVEPMTISAYLDRLERNSLVHRKQDPMDRRARIVFVSERAREVINRVRPMLDMVYEEAMNGVDPSQRESTESALEMARSNLSLRRTRDVGAANSAFG
ncbi:MarR family transcriptional regulator [Jiella mangrovi]|uniref:MarR family transcriptional regulator n=1 Tax=Jiella mangrovi TaxID=2821407 RepID=A0ABS4BEJ2_9HYPH|nr:MarR family transcriptional regulator [Jiella mangrovi]MBP0614479.1 MarR family transcriptional regulator [Jiella mangrovi]